MPEFSYDAAFERNLGLLTEAEQLALRGKRVAIAGMGGVGGVHLITLVRLGIGAFHIADFDRFSLVNFNRQFGANINTIDRPKAQVMEELALAINPDTPDQALRRRGDPGEFGDVPVGRRSVCRRLRLLCHGYTTPCPRPLPRTGHTRDRCRANRHEHRVLDFPLPA